MFIRLRFEHDREAEACPTCSRGQLDGAQLKRADGSSHALVFALGNGMDRCRVTWPALIISKLIEGEGATTLNGERCNLGFHGGKKETKPKDCIQGL